MNLLAALLVVVSASVAADVLRWIPGGGGGLRDLEVLLPRHPPARLHRLGGARAVVESWSRETRPEARDTCGGMRRGRRAELILKLLRPDDSPETSLGSGQRQLYRASNPRGGRRPIGRRAAAVREEGNGGICIILGLGGISGGLCAKTTHLFS